MADTSVRRLPDGRLTLHYDPAMVGQFIHHPTDYSIWSHYDALHIPVLCLRGAQSDLVLRDTTVAMSQRGPGARGQLRCVEIPHCGHAPALNTPEQLQLVSDFLQQVDD
jgi:pimeloyl-ACP methyl ester carboxylesterase